MHESHERLYDTLSRALDKASSESLTSSSLDNIFKIVGTMYKLEKMDGMGDDGYSLDGYSGDRSYDNSYARGRGRNARRDSMGRYARDGYSTDGSYDNSYDGSYGYSGHNKEDVKMEIQNLMNDAKDPQLKQMMQRWMNELN